MYAINHYNNKATTKITKHLLNNYKRILNIITEYTQLIKKNEEQGRKKIIAGTN